MLVGVVSDIHANQAALAAVLADLPKIDELWCLGDIVGYGPDPNECVELLRTQGSVVIVGNHDWAAIGKLSSHGFNPAAAQAIGWTAKTLHGDSVKYLERLPTHLPRGKWTLIHGSPRQPLMEYLLDCHDAQEVFPFLDTPYGLFGHTHIPALFARDDHDPAGCSSWAVVVGETVKLGTSPVLINPGSVGQPRDGDPRASYLLLDTERAMVEFRRVVYDIRRTQQRMARAGLPERLSSRLSYGL